MDSRGRIRWCLLELDDVAVMLQEYWRDGHQGGAPDGVLGQGVSICFMCADALAIYATSFLEKSTRNGRMSAMVCGSPR